MNFDAFSGNRRSRRQTSSEHAPAMIESLETRSLLAAAGPSIISPSGLIASSQPVVKWQPVAGAVSYDLWIADAETRERIVFKEGITGTTTTLSSSERLHLGINRMWVRATLADSSKTEYGTPTEVLLQPRPGVVGPVNAANPAAPTRIEKSDWAVTWTSPLGAASFEVFVSNQTTQTSSVFVVPNQTPVLDAKGVAMKDGAGNPILQEVRSLYLDGAVPVIGAAPQAITSVVNRSFLDITSDNHGLANGDRVRISEVLGNTGANGDFAVTVISENVFRLTNGVSSGTYTSGGKWIRLLGNAPAPGVTSRAIIGASNSKAIDITVANHGLKTGEQVRITGVQGNTAANGTYLATVLSKNVIQLKGVSGADVFTQGGQLLKLTALRSNNLIGQYRVFVRATDDAGRVSAYSKAYDFNVAPVVNVRRPKGSTFETQPLLEWNSVPGATHYQVEVFRVGEVVPVYKADYLTSTSYRIPEPLSTTPVQNFEFRVRALRLHQVSTISLSGTPASGTFTVTLATTGKTPTTATTGPISYNATAADIRNAIAGLPGFAAVDVVAQGTAPDISFLVQIPLTGNSATLTGIQGNPVTVSVTSAVSPGMVTSATVVSPRVDGQWSPLVAFSTIQKPIITGPLGIDNADPLAPITVTDLRPTITWTAIDKAARYELWVERSASTATYLRTNVSGNSYKFAADLLEGNYTVRVRAVSTTGMFTDWSNIYAFTATGGVPVIQSVTLSPARRATIRWAGVAEAATYELQIARIGVDFDYLHPEGITTTSFTTTNSLPFGNYRVWVRAVMADGTKLGWSSYVDFTVANVEEPVTPSLEGLLIAAVDAELTRSARAVSSAPDIAAAHENRESTVVPESPAMELSTSGQDQGQSASRFSVEKPEERWSSDDSLIQTLAAACANQEWWTVAERSVT